MLMDEPAAPVDLSDAARAFQLDGRVRVSPRINSIDQDRWRSPEAHAAGIVLAFNQLKRDSGLWRSLNHRNSPNPWWA